MYKVIKDIVHGDIDYDEDECKLIDSPYLQRLRYIKQNSCAFLVYPSATSSRFEHALGVMSLASKFYDSLFNNPKWTRQFIEEAAKELKHLKLAATDDPVLFLRKVLRVAALTHDVGHFPFSHATEVHFGRHLLKLDKTFISAFNPLFADKHHELLTLGIQNDSDLIENDKIRRAVVLMFLADLEATPENRLISKDFSNLIHFLNKSCFFVLKQIISSTIDADRGDYLLRDGRVSGSGFGQYDITRLLFSLQLCYNSTELRFQLAISEKAQSVIESFLIGRYQIYKNLGLHKKVLIFNKILNEQLKYLELNFQRFFDDSTKGNAASYFKKLTRYLNGNSKQPVKILKYRPEIDKKFREKHLELNTRCITEYNSGGFLDDFWLLTCIRRNKRCKGMQPLLKVLNRQQSAILLWKNFSEMADIIERIWTNKFKLQIGRIFNSENLSLRRLNVSSLNGILNLLFLCFKNTPIETWFKQVQEKISDRYILLWAAILPRHYMAKMEDFVVVDKNGEITDKNAFMTPPLRSVEYSPRKELALHLEEVFVWLACINRDMSKSSRSKEVSLIKKEIAQHLVNNFQQLFLNNEFFRKQVIESLRLSQPKT